LNRRANWDLLVDDDAGVHGAGDCAARLDVGVKY